MQAFLLAFTAIIIGVAVFAQTFRYRANFSRGVVLFVFLLLSFSTFAQTPTTFNYQAVLRDASGGVLANQQVEIGVTLLQGSVTGTEVFTETHSVSTNNFGLANLQIGSVNTTGMENIDWSAGPYFIQISVDGTIMGTSQLLSVPFALHAKTVENDKVDDADADPGNELQILSISNDTIYLSNGGKVKLPPETDPAFTNWDKSTGISITESQISDLDHFTGDDISGNETAFDGWDKDVSDDFDGQYSSLSGAPQNVSAFTNDAAYITSADDADADPTNELQVLSISNDTIYLSNGGKVKLPAETDPAFTNWDKSTGISITESQISDLDHFTGDDISGNETAFDNWDKDASDDFDGQYSSLSGAPQNVSAFTNDAAYITSADDADADPTNELQVLSISNDTIYLSNGGKVKLPAETDPAFSNWDKSSGVAISESQITDLDHFTGDDISGNETAFDGWDKDASDDFDGHYSSLSGAPQNVSAFTNDAAYITSADNADNDPTNELQVLSISNDTIYLSNGGKVKLPSETDPLFSSWDKSTGISITESQITDLDHFSGDDISGNETAFDNWDKDASDDFDGQYSSLSGAPQNVSAFTNDAAYITSADNADNDPANELQVLSISNDTIYLSNGGKVKLPAETDPAFTNWDKSTGISISESQISDLDHFTGDDISGNETAFDGWDKDASDDFDGQYSSLSGAPQKVSDFTNDAAYITSADDADADPTNELQVLSISNDTIYLSDGGKVKLPAGNAMSLDAAYDNGRTITADAGAFEINGNSGVLFTGTFGSSDTPPASGAGTRMMWYPAKAAFRAGGVNSTQWDSPNIGNYSVALGYYNLASGDRSTALGQETKAQGNSSTAMGYRAIAGELASTAMGHTTTASGDASSALGYKTTASGKHSTATGQETTASGINSTAMGDSTDAIGFASTAMGYKTTASGDASTTIGYNTEASGKYSTAMGVNTTASQEASTAMGKETKAEGNSSTAMGYRTTASGAASTAMGHTTTARGYASTAIGKYNLGFSNAIFEIGIGEDFYWENALTVFQNGCVAIGGIRSPSDNYKLDVAGNIRASAIRTDHNVYVDDNIFVKGKVGIGTTSHDYPLEVYGYRNSESHAYAYLQYHSIAALTGKNTATRNYSIVASDNIRAEMFCAISDQRIKTNIQHSNGTNELTLINKIEVVDYQYIDKVEKGNITKKGFIAQQVEKVLPGAVAKSKAFIPDIYKKASRVVADSTANTLTISTPVAHNLKEGNLLRFITLGGTHEKEVLSVLSDNTFTVEKPEGDCSQVFVYGKKVDDFRAIDYDQVFSAGIGAIQELSRQNDELKQTIENLQNENSSLHAENSDIKQRLETLEALVKNTLNGLATEKASAQK